MAGGEAVYDSEQAWAWTEQTELQSHGQLDWLKGLECISQPQLPGVKRVGDNIHLTGQLLKGKEERKTSTIYYLADTQKWK